MIAVLGWIFATGLLVAMLGQRRRLGLVADAAHELRGPVTAMSFAVAALRREPGGVRRALRFESELERMRAGLGDLEAARSGRRAVGQARVVSLSHVVDVAAEGWAAAAAAGGRTIHVRDGLAGVKVRADRGRLAQLLGNVLGNAVEHGSGPIEIRAVRRGPRAVRVEVRDGGPSRRLPAERGHDRARRGRGLGIARRAAEGAGGSVAVETGSDGTVATLELPVADLGDLR